MLETAEEDRADAPVRQVGFELAVPVHEWTVTRGLAALDGTPGMGIYGTMDPAKALESVPDMDGNAIFVFKDFARHLEDPALSRRFRELLAAFRAQLAMSPQAAELNLPAPRGVMLVGVQGCGKSLSAKFVARNWNLPLLKLDAGRLYDKYVGETERNLRRAIGTAEALSPVVLWIDEIEKALSASGDSDGGVSRRVFATFLTWLQEKRADVFVVATANDLSILPPELLRKGRFDEIRGTVALSRSRAEDVQRLRQWASGRFVPVGG